jgi:hypothetical protein
MLSVPLTGESRAHHGRILAQAAVLAEAGKLCLFSGLRDSQHWTRLYELVCGSLDPLWRQLAGNFPRQRHRNDPYLDVSLVAVTINPSGLAAGTYYGKVQVSATAANTPPSVTVILTVLPAGSTIGTQLYPTGLIFTGVAGVTPGSQDVQVGNLTGQANSFQSAQLGTEFSYLPTNASIQPNQPTTVRVYPDFSKLTPGSIQQGTIVLQFSDLSPQQVVKALFVVAPAGATANRVDGKVSHRPD